MWRVAKPGVLKVAPFPSHSYRPKLKFQLEDCILISGVVQQQCSQVMKRFKGSKIFLSVKCVQCSVCPVNHCRSTALLAVGVHMPSPCVTSDMCGRPGQGPARACKPGVLGRHPRVCGNRLPSGPQTAMAEVQCGTAGQQYRSDCAVGLPIRQRQTLRRPPQYPVPGDCRRRQGSHFCWSNANAGHHSS
jgi:hypothetical protein